MCSKINRCPKEVSPHLQAILSLCSQYLRHDPNYHYDDETNGNEADTNNTMEVDEADRLSDDNEGDENDENGDDDQHVCTYVQHMPLCLFIMFCYMYFLFRSIPMMTTCLGKCDELRRNVSRRF